MKRILTTLIATIALIAPSYCAEPSEKSIELYNLGIDLYQTGEVQKSIDSFNEAIKLSPDFYEAYYNLGQIQLSTNKLDDAIETYTKIYNMRPDDDENLYTLAKALYKRGYLAKSSSYYKQIPTDSSYFKQAQEDLSKLTQRQKELQEEAKAKREEIQREIEAAQVSMAKTNEQVQTQLNKVAEISANTKTAVDNKTQQLIKHASQTSTVAQNRVQQMAQNTTSEVIKTVGTQGTIAKMPAIPSKTMTYEGVMAPSGVSMDSKGNVYIASFSENTIYKIDPQGVKTIFADSTALSGPVGIAIDKWDNLYVANYTKGNVIKINQKGDWGILTTVKNPYCLNITGDNLFITEQGSNTVIRYSI